MSTLPEIAEALCKRVAQHDFVGAKGLAIQMAAKMGAPRGPRIQRAFEADAWQVTGRKLNSWTPVAEPRSPWIPDDVRSGIDAWLSEAQHAEELASQGERVMPLMLAGETRCGKTSSLAGLATRLGLPVYRLLISSIVGSHLGETAAKVHAALGEATGHPVRAIWLIDEIDGAAPRRGGDSSADKELAAGVASMLTLIENIPPRLLLCATTNIVKLIDPAIVARFQVVAFPRWDDIDATARLEFASSHGHGPAADGAKSYADAVIAARRYRVDAIIAAAKAGVAPGGSAGENVTLFAEASA